MLDPHPHLSHALSSMYEFMHRCMKKKKGKENITLWWWFWWWSDTYIQQKECDMVEWLSWAQKR